MQKQFCIPTFVRDAWHGPTRICLVRALRDAGITATEFYDCWKAKIKSCRGTESGKKELLELLRKGGIRACDNADKRLQQKIWFINEVVGRTSIGLRQKVTRKACIMWACMYVHVHVYIYTYFDMER